MRKINLKNLNLNQLLGTVETEGVVQDTRAGDRRTQEQEQEESLRMFFGDRRCDLDLDEEATLQEVSIEKTKCSYREGKRDMLFTSHVQNFFCRAFIS